ALTVILAIGAQRILKRKALVRKLVAAETLGNVSIIATDKTGTITKAIMEVSEIVPAEVSKEASLKLPDGEFSEAIFEEKGPLLGNILETAWLASDAEIENPGAALHDIKIVGSPTEVAIVKAANRAGIDRDKLNERFTRKDVIPFTSARKFMAVLLSEKGGADQNLVFLKGASEKLIPASKYYEDQNGVQEMSDKAQKCFLDTVDQLSAQGLRVLAVAKSSVAKNVQELSEDEDELLQDLTYLGLIVIKDPLRPNVYQTIKQVADAGVKTILITGDHAETARAIAKEIGLPANKKNVITGTELKELDEREFRKRLRDIRIYARVTPEDKLRIIDAWQAEGEVIAMTGDGVNDAPAVQGADIGLAVGSGSDVVKETADLILLDNNFKTIVAAVEEGRTIFDNFRKVTRYLLSDSFTEIIVILFSFIVGWPLPILATQILWVNIVNDGAPDVALAFDPQEDDIMNEPPRDRKEPILGRADLWLIGLISVVTATGILLLFWWTMRTSGDLAYARTMAFTLLGIDSLFYIFSIRSLRHSIFREHFFSNKWLLGAVVLGFILQISAIYVPFLQKIFETVSIGLVDWLLILGSVAVTILIIELAKYILRPRKKK
ncbi:cation-translocating P-type ATPase, partial [Patescibacteria group bacterium]